MKRINKKKLTKQNDRTAHGTKEEEKYNKGQ